MNDVLINLVKLQEEDIRIDALQKKIDNIPVKIKKLRDDFQESSIQVDQIKTEINHLLVEKKNKDIELTTKEQQIRKHQTELFAIKNNKQYTALQHEIDSLKKQVSFIEDEILAFLDENDNLDIKLKEMQEIYKKQQENLEDKIDAFEKEKEDLASKLLNYSKIRNDIESSIPQNELQVYEKIRNKWRGIAVVEIKDSSCGGCHMRVQPEVINEVRKGDHMVMCENCYRILFLKNQSLG